MLAKNKNAGDQVRETFIQQCTTMVTFAVENGIKLEEDALKKFDQIFLKSQESNISLDELISFHNYLVGVIHPVTPQNLKARKQEIFGKTWFSRIGLVKKLILFSTCCLIGLLFLSLSENVNGDPKNFNLFANSGVSLLLNELFLVVSAGLGASFAALFKANKFVEQGIYDPAYETSYWIKVILGLVAGTILAMLVPIEEIEKIAEGSGQTHLSSLNGLGKPLLAIAGGFSANLVYKALLKIVQFLESMLDAVIPTRVVSQSAPPYRITNTRNVVTPPSHQDKYQDQSDGIIELKEKDIESNVRLKVAGVGENHSHEKKQKEKDGFKTFLRDFVVLGEGCRSKVYLDSLGIPTIGIGCNLKDAGNQKLLESLEIDYQRLLDGSDELSDEQINSIFDVQIENCQKQVTRLCKNFSSLSSLRQVILIDIIFNLGYGRLSQFKNFLKAVGEEDFYRAAEEMKDSRWFRQVKQRGERNVFIMAHNSLKGAPYTESLDPGLLESKVKSSYKNIA